MIVTALHFEEPISVPWYNHPMRNACYAAGNMVIPLVYGVGALLVTKILGLEAGALMSIATSITSATSAPMLGSFPVLLRRDVKTAPPYSVLARYFQIGVWTQLVCIVPGFLYLITQDTKAYSLLVAFIISKQLETLLELNPTFYHSVDDLPLYGKYRFTQITILTISFLVAVLTKHLVLQPLIYLSFLLPTFLYTISKSTKEPAKIRVDIQEIFKLSISAILFVLQSRIVLLISAILIPKQAIGLIASISGIFATFALLAQALGLNTLETTLQQDFRLLKDVTAARNHVREVNRRLLKGLLTGFLIIALAVLVKPLLLGWITKNHNVENADLIYYCAILGIPAAFIQPILGYYPAIFKKSNLNLIMNAAFVTANIALSCYACLAYKTVGMAISMAIVPWVYTTVLYIIFLSLVLKYKQPYETLPAGDGH